MRYRVAVITAIAGVLVGAASRVGAQKPGTLTAMDYIEIQQLYARYNNAIDAGDGEAYAATFTPDGVFNNNTGREGLLKFVEQYKGQMNGLVNRHWNTNLTITPSPEGASGTVYLMLVDVSARPPVIRTAARYEDSLVKTAQGWRFKKRTTRGDTAPAKTQQ
jgi:bifunctional aromatase (cyclase/dehydratase)